MDGSIRHSSTPHLPHHHAHQGEPLEILRSRPVTIQAERKENEKPCPYQAKCLPGQDGPTPPFSTDLLSQRSSSSPTQPTRPVSKCAAQADISPRPAARSKRESCEYRDETGGGLAGAPRPRGTSMYDPLAAGTGCCLLCTNCEEMARALQAMQ